MNTITFKADDVFLKKLVMLTEEVQVTKSELIRKAVIEYERHLRRERLKSNIREASLKVRAANRTEITDFDEMLNDGLENV